MFRELWKGPTPSIVPGDRREARVQGADRSSRCGGCSTASCRRSAVLHLRAVSAACATPTVDTCTSPHAGQARLPRRVECVVIALGSDDGGVAYLLIVRQLIGRHRPDHRRGDECCTSSVTRKPDSRSNWDGDDELRPLSRADGEQAEAIGDRPRLEQPTARRSSAARSPLPSDTRGARPPMTDPSRRGRPVGEGCPVRRCWRFVESLPDGAVLCSHGDVIGELIDALVRHGCELTSPTGARAVRGCSDATPTARSPRPGAGRRPTPEPVRVRPLLAESTVSAACYGVDVTGVDDAVPSSPASTGSAGRARPAADRWPGTWSARPWPPRVPAWPRNGPGRRRAGDPRRCRSSRR